MHTSSIHPISEKSSTLPIPWKAITVNCGKSPKTRGSVPFRYGIGESCISGIYTYPKEMNPTDPELRLDHPATGNTVPGQIPDNGLGRLFF